VAAGEQSMRQILLAVSLALIASTSAFAHAHLESSTPAANSTVPMPPAEVAIVLSEEIEPKFSTIEVKDGARHAHRQG
jgi:methionine-rich copper-binding protein CopC